MILEIITIGLVILLEFRRDIQRFIYKKTALKTLRKLLEGRIKSLLKRSVFNRLKTIEGINIHDAHTMTLPEWGMININKPRSTAVIDAIIEEVRKYCF